jgi:hypothetical protein
VFSASAKTWAGPALWQADKIDIPACAKINTNVCQYSSSSLTLLFSVLQIWLSFYSWRYLIFFVSLNSGINLADRPSAGVFAAVCKRISKIKIFAL